MGSAVTSTVSRGLSLPSSSARVSLLGSTARKVLGDLARLVTSYRAALSRVSSNTNSFTRTARDLSSLDRALRALRGSLSTLSTNDLRLARKLASFRRKVRRLSRNDSALSRKTAGLNATKGRLGRKCAALTRKVSSLSRKLALFSGRKVRRLGGLNKSSLGGLSGEVGTIGRTSTRCSGCNNGLRRRAKRMQFVVRASKVSGWA